MKIQKEHQTLILFSVFLASGMTGCASPSKTEQEVATMVPYKFKVRRPPGAGADPKAGPGGVDYRSNPAPSASFDCEELGFLFRSVPLAPVRECLAGIASEFVIHYRLRRVAQPYLEIQNPDESPECLKKVLPKIPVPREIVFQARKQDDLDASVQCYSSRVEIEADEILGAKVPMAQFVMQLRLPLDPATLPKTDEETVRALGAWALTPLWDPEKRAWRAKAVPRSTCKACLGEKEMIEDKEPTPVTWP